MSDPMERGQVNDDVRQHLRDTAETLGLNETEQRPGLVDVAAALGLDYTTTNLAKTYGWTVQLVNNMWDFCDILKRICTRFATAGSHLLGFRRSVDFRIANVYN